MTDEEYLTKVKESLTQGLEEFKPELVVYVAGTDVVKGDLVGEMDLELETVIKRDEIVFELCKMERNIPVAMTTSGGFQKANAPNIADSIENLIKKRLIKVFD